jgi:hypothetical protein
LVLLAHTGSERTLPVIAPWLESPRVLTRPLEIGVTCIAAHSATSVVLIDPDYFGDFVAMLRQYPNLYGDNSALGAPNFRLWGRRLREMLEPEVECRILHGSDLPVPVGGASLCALGALSWRDFRLTRAIANPVERDVAIKRALGFSEATFTRLAPLLRRR